MVLRIFLILLTVSTVAFGVTKEEIDRQLQKAWQMYEKGKYVSMEKISKKVVQESKGINYPKGIAEGYYYIGIAYFMRGKIDKALEYANLAVDFSQKHNNYRWKAYSHTLVGEILRYLGKYDKALYHFKISLQLAEDNKNQKMLPAAYANLGNIYFDRKEYDKAIKYYLKGLEIGKKINIRPSYIALNSYNTGIAHFRLKNWDNAVKYLQEAYKIYIQLGDKKSAVSSAYFIAKSYYLAGDYWKAKQVVEKNTPLAKQVLQYRKFKKLLNKINRKLKENEAV
ncbi:tetratricopeptide repeat protein [Persephonella sp.]|uniref:tetratricopeptide repeat protein n=1 Tax=Persephonella sp. TaxID=2060922 RepID=UPI002612814E|nr:tetratricopeptide repeat protein [Persephonella sp.]